MQQAFLNLNGVRTNVLAYGRWIEEAPKVGQPEDIILIIPGNPGIVDFYKMFMHTLHEKTGFPVWIVSHAGHEIPKNNAIEPIPPLASHKAKFNLQGQIEHKLEFIEKYIRPETRIHFVGHSIGSYIILELMKHESINSRTVDASLLFPTLEHMADTPNGKFMSTFVKPILWLILFLALLFANLPRIISNFMLYVYMKIAGIPKMHFRTLHRLVNPQILEKVFFMAYDELANVNERNNATIAQNVGKLRLLYGADDGWAPTSYYDKLKVDIKGVNAEISNFNHAFVLKQSRQIGVLVSDWIVKK